MRDFNKPLRKALVDLLDNQLTYDSVNIPVYDKKVKKGADNNNYVVIGTISSTDGGTLHTWTRQMNVILEVTTKMADAVSTNIADNISEQIFTLIMPAVGLNSLVQAHFQYLNLSLETDRYLDFQLTPTMSMVRRLLTFSITVNQTD